MARNEDSRPKGGWPFATERRIEKLEAKLKAVDKTLALEIAQLKKEREDHGFKGVIAALRDIAKAIRESGGGDPGSLDKLGETTDKITEGVKEIKEVLESGAKTPTPTSENP